MINLEPYRQRVWEMVSRYAYHDTAKLGVHMVRSGDLAGAYPRLFNEELDFNPTANFIDIAARDFAEMVAPLPALNTSSGRMTSEQARRFAEKRKKIGAAYWDDSNLAIQMAMAADMYQLNGVAYAVVEPDFRCQAPRIRFFDGWGCYPDFDLQRNTVAFAHRWMVRASVLAAQYPEKAGQILKDGRWGADTGDRIVTLFRWYDDKRHLVWIDEDRIILEDYPNLLGECPVTSIVRPPGPKFAGAYDDLTGVQAARAFMMRLCLQSAEDQVNAPLIVPSDTNDIPVGPLSLLHTDNPQGVHRANLSVGDSTFREMATLQTELLTGARTPQQRFGSQPGSIVTGKGVEALLGGYDAQVKQAQNMFADGLRNITRLCFKLDEKYWPNREREIRGQIDGTPYAITYTPKKDIAGDYTCDISYGFTAGLDPNRAIVFMLQLLAAGVIPREFVARSLPFDLDVSAMQNLVEQEKLNDAAMNGLAAMVQAIGPMAQQGEDPALILGVVSDVVKGRAKNKPLAELIADAFTTYQEKKQQQQAEQMQQMMAQMQGAGGAQGGPGGPGGPGGQPGSDSLRPSGLLQGVAWGQAGQAPGGRPAVQDLMAGIGANGQPNVRAGVRRMMPAS